MPYASAGTTCRKKISVSSKRSGGGDADEGAEHPGRLAEAAVQEEPGEQEKRGQLQRGRHAECGAELGVALRDAGDAAGDEEEDEQVGLALDRIDPEGIEAGGGAEDRRYRPRRWPQPAERQEQGRDQCGLPDREPEDVRGGVRKEPQRCDEEREERRVDVGGSQRRVGEGMVEEGRIERLAV